MGTRAAGALRAPRGGPGAPRPRPRALPGPAPRGRASPAPSNRARLLRLMLIPLVALLLGGIVWVNVARLNLTTRTSATVERYRGVQAEIVRLKATLAQRDGEVIDRARTRLGMVQARGDDVTYLQIPRGTLPPP